jgi:hypothetical protein
VPIIDCHDHIFSEKGHRVALVGDLIKFHASGEGPRGHATLHHAIVLELVLDEVGMVRSSPFTELLKVVHGQLRLTLAAACDRRGVLHAGATRLLADVAIVVSHGHGLQAVLLAPPLAALGALLDTLDGDVGQCSPTGARG